FFFSSRRRHTRFSRDWSSDVCSSDLRAPYEVLADWHDEHDGNLRIMLPDTFGTEGFLEHAPDWLASWTGIRIDSGDAANGAETRSEERRVGKELGSRRESDVSSAKAG